MNSDTSSSDSSSAKNKEQMQNIHVRVTPTRTTFVKQRLSYLYNNLTVIIPTLNEEKNIYELLYYIDTQYPGINIIVSDDGSADRTQHMVNQYHYKNSNVSLLDRTNAKVNGLTASVLDAVKQVETKYFLVIDGDFQHPPEKIHEMHAKLYLWQDNDIVIGTRNKIIKDWAFIRKLASSTAILLGRMRLMMRGIYCKDVVSGFFGGKTALFKNVIDTYESKFEGEGYKVLFELLKYVDKNVRISTVYYDFGMRKRGKSKMNTSHVFSYIKSVLK